MNRSLGILFLLLSLPVSALAQSPPEWTTRLTVGKPVFLTTQSGERVEGLAGQLTGEGLVVATPAGIRTVSYGELRRAEKRDSVWNGVAIGAVSGVVVGIAAVAPSDCSTDHCVSEATGAVIGAGIYGALIGWGIDALVKGRTTVFRADAATGLSLSPRRGGFSARAVFSW